MALFDVWRMNEVVSPANEELGVLALRKAGVRLNIHRESPHLRQELARRMHFVLRRWRVIALRHFARLARERGCSHSYKEPNRFAPELVPGSIGPRLNQTT